MDKTRAREERPVQCDTNQRFMEPVQAPAQRSEAARPGGNCKPEPFKGYKKVDIERSSEARPTRTAQRFAPPLLAICLALIRFARASCSNSHAMQSDAPCREI